MSSEENRDFVFRFKLDPEAPGDTVYDDPLTELVRSQLEALLEVVVLTRGGEELRGVDGFRYMKHLDRQYDIYSEKQD
jgi:hypothetical protein